MKRKFILLAISALASIFSANALEPKIFVGLDYGTGKTEKLCIVDGGSSCHNPHDRNIHYATFSPNIGVSLTDKWDIGLRGTFRTKIKLHDWSHIWGGAPDYSLELFGRYSFLSYKRLRVNIVPSVVFTDYGHEYLTRLGVSPGASLRIYRGLSTELRYLYFGFFGGNAKDRYITNNYCVGSNELIRRGHGLLDYGWRTLEIGLKYTF